MKRFVDVGSTDKRKRNSALAEAMGNELHGILVVLIDWDGANRRWIVYEKGDELPYQKAPAPN